MDHLQLSSFVFKFKTPSCLLLLLITIFTVSLDQVLSKDPKFEVCAPKSCGDDTPPISYPFWIDTNESYCGHPNFQITCKYGQPVLAISDDDFIIKDIYPNNTVLVVDSAAYEDTCLSDLHNFSLDHTPFRLNASQLDFFFLYNCSSEPKPGGYYPTYAIDCASNDVNKSFAVFHVEELQYMNYSFESCQSVVRTTVRDSLDVLTMNYTEILRMGFLLDWTAHDCSGCKASDGRCGYDNNEFVCFCADGPQSETCKRGKDRIDLGRKLAIAFGTALGSVVIMLVLFYFYLRRRKRKKAAYLLSQNISSDPSSRVVDIDKSNHLGVHLFSYFELEEATNNFDSAKELGDGGFGTVYYGKLRDGRAVAVKRLYDHNFKRVEQFMNEVAILTRLRHKNLVSLYGCTSRHSRELLLVYEYVSNGTVADHLHGDRAKPGSLPLPTRLKIAVETANALSYLHASDIIHRDVKTNNILLDEHFCVKVADFGLSRLFPTNVTHVSTAPQGTPGYVDPDYHQCYQLTDKSDVYSFGVVLIELISSMPAVDITRHRHEINLSNLAIGKIQGKAVHELVDPALGYGVDGRARRAVEAVAELAFGCLQGEKDLRPSMVEVLEALKGIQSEMCDTEEVVLSPGSAGMGWSSSNDTTPNASL